MPDVSLGLAGPFAHGRVISEVHAPDDLAAGVALTIKIGGRYWERPVALGFVVSAGTDDVVSDVTVTYLDGSGVAVVKVETGPAIAATTSATYSLAASYTGAPSWSNNIVNAMLPPLLLQPSWSIVVQPIGTWTEGTISNIRFYREKFVTGPGGYEIGVQQDEPSSENLLQMLADRLA